MAQHGSNFFEQQQALTQIPFLPQMLQNPQVARMLLAAAIGGRPGRSQRPQPAPESPFQQIPGAPGGLGSIPPQFIQALLGGQSGRTSSA